MGRISTRRAKRVRKKSKWDVEIGRHGLQTMREKGEAEGNESNQE
jgi:hypothetical protein